MITEETKQLCNILVENHLSDEVIAILDVVSKGITPRLHNISIDACHTFERLAKRFNDPYMTELADRIHATIFPQ